MNLRGQAGFAILPFSVVMAAIMASIFIFASNKSKDLTDRFASSQAVGYANEISTKLAQRVRWSYDAARADAANPALGLCTSYGGANVPIPTRNFRLCLVGGRICVKHPQLSTREICVTPNGADPTLISQVETRPTSKTWAKVVDALLPTADAQNIYTPIDLPSGVTSNALTVNSSACIGGECRAICTTNADCVTFKFCPLVSDCTPNQMVWQTVALIR